MATIEEKRMALKRKRLADQRALGASAEVQPAQTFEPAGPEGSIVESDTETGIALSRGGIEGDKKALAGFLTTLDPQARQDIIKENIPGSEIVEVDGVTFVDLPIQGGRKLRTTLNKEGFSEQDIQDFAGLALQFAPQGGLLNMGKNFMQRAGIIGAKDAAIETARQFASKGFGSEQDVSPSQIAITGASSLAGQTVGEIGGQAFKQATEGLKGIFRGGESGRQAVQQSIDAFNVSGATPTLGQATGRPSLQAVESVSGKSPGGRPLRAQLDKTANQVQQKLINIADDLSTTKGSEAAGRVIKKGIAGDNGFIDRFKSQSSELWSAVDDFIDPTEQVQITNTKAALDDLIRDDVFGDILNNKQLEKIKSIIDDADGIVDFEAVRSLRSIIGRKIGNNDLLSDIPRAELKQVYGALSSDIRDVAAGKGDDAIKAFDRANNFTRSGHGRIDDFVENVTKKVDLDKIFKAVTRGGDGAQTINAFKRSLKPEEWEVVVSNVVRKMGKATSGRQDDLGEAFSLNKFLTDWDKLGDAKGALFSGSKKINTMKSDLDAIAATASRVKEASSELAGQSGTAQLAAGISTPVAIAGAAGTGNLKLAGGLLSLVAANNGAARMMSSPKFVKWLAESTKVTSSELPKQIAKLGVIAENSDGQIVSDINEFIEMARQK